MAMKQSRSYTSFFKKLQVGPFIRHELSTNNTVQNEIFGSLDFLSEVEEVGIRFLRNAGQTRNLGKRYLQFQALLRQAKSFYEAAEVLHPRASPLNYYYSFYNLAKAYIFLSDPAYVVGRPHHGLTYHHKPGSLSKQFVITRDGVFPKLYKLVTGENVGNKTPLNIVNLLGYSSDVGAEYQIGGFGVSKLVRCNFAITINQQANNCTPVLACHNYQPIEKFSKSLKTFSNYFEEVETDNRVTRELFDVLAEFKSDYKFFESKNVYPLAPNGGVPVPMIVEDTHAAIKYFFESNSYSDVTDFFMAAPLRINHQIPMREILSIYLIMFYLCSLVRYRPDYLEKLYASKDAWIIERFTQSAPITCLRHFRNLIDGRVFNYKVR